MQATKITILLTAALTLALSGCVVVPDMPSAQVVISGGGGGGGGGHHCPPGQARKGRC